MTRYGQNCLVSVFGCLKRSNPHLQPLTYTIVLSWASRRIRPSIKVFFLKNILMGEIPVRSSLSEEVEMLVDAQIFKVQSYLGAGDGIKVKLEKMGLLIWRDNTNEWSIEIWRGKPEETLVLLRQNGKPTNHTSLCWKRGRSDEIDELVISKVSEGCFANETSIDIWPSKACVRIEKILETVAIGEVSDRLPVIL